MKLKPYLLLACLWAVPALGMGQTLTGETIVTHTQFVVLKQKFEKIGAKIEVFKDHIYIDMVYDESYRCGYPIYYSNNAFFYSNQDFFTRADLVYQEMSKTKKNCNLNNTVHESLQGLCILELARQFRDGNKNVIAAVVNLPDEFKLKIYSLARLRAYE